MGTAVNPARPAAEAARIHLCGKGIGVVDDAAISPRRLTFPGQWRGRTESHTAIKEVSHPL
ncbi:hypothetical protein BKG82_12750 [Mycobacteroides chelonae]|uniref:Uncharacterized protein n=1 Tax=Mycobacteroides chelonae TaxID=1774 RepID=A0A1S1LP29_MYCCH|nr:hypothetical protein BKG82_12750 [Mycobacteroides chelonae]